VYNFSIPSVLKAWFDHLARAGKTFKYTANGPEGLVKGKKIYLAIASGAIFSEGEMKSYDFVEPYLRVVLGFLGMTDVTTIRVEGVAIPGLKETALERAVASIAI
jgi:FMN-dependent NADH-azoreductase